DPDRVLSRDLVRGERVSPAVRGENHAGRGDVVLINSAAIDHAGEGLIDLEIIASSARRRVGFVVIVWSVPRPTHDVLAWSRIGLETGIGEDIVGARRVDQGKRRGEEQEAEKPAGSGI